MSNNCSTPSQPTPLGMANETLGIEGDVSAEEVITRFIQSQQDLFQLISNPYARVTGTEFGAGHSKFDINSNEVELLRSYANEVPAADSVGATSAAVPNRPQQFQQSSHQRTQLQNKNHTDSFSVNESSENSDDEDSSHYSADCTTRPSSSDNPGSTDLHAKTNGVNEFDTEKSNSGKISLTTEQLLVILGASFANRVQPLLRPDYMRKGAQLEGVRGGVNFNLAQTFPRKMPSSVNMLGEGNILSMGRSGGAEDDQKNGDQKTTRVRASKMSYMRIDELFNKKTHDFYLTETSPSTDRKDDVWEEYIFIVRRLFDWSNKKQKTYVDIKSIEIRDILRQILKDVNGVGLREDKPTVEPNLLFNYLPQIEDVLCKEKAKTGDARNDIKIQHLSVLIDYVTTDYASVAKRLYPLLKHQEITFDLLWALFLPNTLIFTTCPGSKEPRCLKLDWGQQKESMNRGKFFQLECHYVDFDGKSFGMAQALIEIDEFRGARRIDSLVAFPLAYHSDEENMREKLICRGRKFGSLGGMHYKFYKGIAFYKRKRTAVRLNINARIIVDPLTFRRINPNYPMSPVKPGETSYSTSGAVGTNSEYTCSENSAEEDDCEQEDDDDDINSLPMEDVKPKSKPPETTLEEFIKLGIKNPHRSYVLGPDGKMKLVSPSTDRPNPSGGAGSSKSSMVPNDMSEEELLLCSPTVLGFSFGDKVWAEFAVENIHEIEFNPHAFDSLVLPENQKNIVRALVESHIGKAGKAKGGIDDIIKGKGKGLVAVLHGRPGVGKTLTAEGISEYLKRPLYMVSAGELGTNTQTLEQQLSRILDVAHTWNAVLLLDEADVFLERRSVHDLQRNALVSIFLRLLEYFQGILFLTTNRVETFDEAFQSRIHIAVRYNDLDRKAKSIIWKTFLGMVAREEVASTEERESHEDPNATKTQNENDRKPLREIVTKEQLENLARRNCNGRQIKNVVRTAQALAGTMDEKLSMKHLELVLEVTEDFEHDLKGTGQLDGMMSYA